MDSVKSQPNHQTVSAMAKIDDRHKIQSTATNQLPNTIQDQPSIDAKNTQQANHGQQLQNMKNELNIPRESVIFAQYKTTEVISNKSADIPRNDTLLESNIEPHFMENSMDRKQQYELKSSCVQNTEIIDLLSDDESCENQTTNIVTKDNENVACMSQPTIQKRKKKTMNATVAGSSMKKQKVTDPVDDPANRFKCDFCDYSTGKKPNLNRHVACVHTSEKPYECEICKKQFSRKDNLRQHMKLHE